MAWITISSLQRATDTWCCLSRNFLNINTPSAVDMHHQSGGAYLTDRTIRDHSYDWILFNFTLSETQAAKAITKAVVHGEPKTKISDTYHALDACIFAIFLRSPIFYHFF